MIRTAATKAVGIELGRPIVRRALRSGFLVAVCMMVIAPTAVGSPRLRWLAAGDSYSPGEGSSHAAGPCAQARSASHVWAQVAYKDLGPYAHKFAPPQLVACTGAPSWQFFAPSSSMVAGLPPEDSSGAMVADDGPL
jgi:hypothetical protein